MAIKRAVSREEEIPPTAWAGGQPLASGMGIGAGALDAGQSKDR